MSLSKECADRMNKFPNKDTAMLIERVFISQVAVLMSGGEALLSIYTKPDRSS